MVLLTICALEFHFSTSTLNIWVETFSQQVCRRNINSFSVTYKNGHKTILLIDLVNAPFPYQTLALQSSWTAVHAFSISLGMLHAKPQNTQPIPTYIQFLEPSTWFPIIGLRSLSQSNVVKQDCPTTVPVKYLCLIGHYGSFSLGHFSWETWYICFKLAVRVQDALYFLEAEDKSFFVTAFLMYSLERMAMNG